MADIVCIIDGMTDEEFQLKDYSQLASLTEAGISGYLATTPPGFGAGTLPCVLTLLGLEEERIPRKGRGWLEALGLGIPVKAGDLVLRGTWTALDESGRLRGMAKGPEPEELPRTAGLRYYSAGPDKAVLVLEGQGKALHRLVTCPPHENWGQPIDSLPVRVCPLLEEFLAACRRPGLALLPWGESAAAELPRPNLPLRAAAVTATPVVKGIARQLGMMVIRPPGATGDVDTDLAGKTAAALSLCRDYPLVLLHIDGADEAAHRLLPEEKRRFLRRVDREVLKTLAGGRDRLLITADHGTSPYTGRHLREPQPFVLWGPGLKGPGQVSTLIKPIPGVETLGLFGKYSDGDEH